MRRWGLLVITLSLLSLCSCVKIISRKRAGSNDFALSALGTWVPKDVHYLYVTNRKSNSISMYRSDPSSADPKTAFAALPVATVATGARPMGLHANPVFDTAYVLNQNDNTISGYALEYETGMLTALTGSPFSAKSDSGDSLPEALAYSPDGKFLYVTFAGIKDIWVYEIDPSTGALKRIQTNAALFVGRTWPWKIMVTPDGSSLLATSSPVDADADLLIIESYTRDLNTGKLIAHQSQTESLLGDGEYFNNMDFDPITNQLNVEIQKFGDYAGTANVYAEQLVSIAMTPADGKSVRTVKATAVPARFSVDGSISDSDLFNEFKAKLVSTPSGDYWIDSAPSVASGETSRSIDAYKLKAGETLVQETAAPPKSNVVSVTTPVALGAVSPDTRAIYHVFKDTYQAQYLPADALDDGNISFQRVGSDGLSQSGGTLLLKAGKDPAYTEFVLITEYAWESSSKANGQDLGAQFFSMFGGMVRSFSDQPPTIRDTHRKANFMSVHSGG